MKESEAPSSSSVFERSEGQPGGVSETCFVAARRGVVVASCACLANRQLQLFGPVPVIVPCRGALEGALEQWLPDEDFDDEE